MDAGTGMDPTGRTGMSTHGIKKKKRCSPGMSGLQPRVSLKVGFNLGFLDEIKKSLLRDPCISCPGRHPVPTHALCQSHSVYF